MPWRRNGRRDGPQPITRRPCTKWSSYQVPETKVPLACRTMLGELEAVIVEVKPWDVHGVGYVDVTVVYPDRMLETARLGPESVPEDLEAGERVMVTKAVNMILGIRRA
jgi:hypothetical protein